MISRTRVNTVPNLIRRFSATNTAFVLQQSQSQLVQRAQADLAKDLNLAVSSRKSLARRLNGPTIPVPRSDNISLPRPRGKAKGQKTTWKPRVRQSPSPIASSSKSPIVAAATAHNKPTRRLSQATGDETTAKKDAMARMGEGVKRDQPNAETVSIEAVKRDTGSSVIPPAAEARSVEEVTGLGLPEVASGNNDSTCQTLKQEASIDEVLRDQPPHFDPGQEPGGKASFDTVNQGTIVAVDVPILEVKPHREMQVARLRSQLSRVLFSPGVHPMHDPRTGVWNFDEAALHTIPQPSEFAFDRVPSYISPSGDTELSDLAEEHDCAFTGSTSTLTKALSQIYFALSGGKGVDLNTLSQAFSFQKTDFTAGASLAACLVLGKKPNGQYFVDSDKQWDVENVLSDFGVILERMLTTEKDDFPRLLQSSPLDSVAEEERTKREAYRYQKSTTLLMRSQLDCYDPRLPGTGVFDIKTRACLPIRFDRANYIANSAYDISKDRGYRQSYEKEYYDLIRAGMLKFSFQVRIGAMDGIFVAYHNTARIYGFQYLPLTELDERLFGSSEMADQAFKLCVSLLEVLLAEAVKSFPDEEVELTIKRIDSWKSHRVGAFVQPRQWDFADGPRPTQLISLTLENLLDGEKVAGPIGFSVDEATRGDQKWSVNYTLSKTRMDAASQAAAALRLQTARKDLASMMYIALPEGKTIEQMQGEGSQSIRNPTDKDIRGVKWRVADGKLLALRREAKESGEAYEQRKSMWKRNQKGWLPA